MKSGRPAQLYLITLVSSANAMKQLKFYREPRGFREGGIVTIFRLIPLLLRSVNLRFIAP